MERIKRLPGVRHVLAARRKPAVQRILKVAQPLTRPVKRKLLGP